MASTNLATKQLAELLQEQQEPFILEIFLLERGYSKNKSNLEHNTSRKFSERRKITPSWSKGVRGLFNRLGYFNRSVKDPERREQNITEDDSFYSASSGTRFNSCTDSDKEDRYASPRKGHQKYRNQLSEGEVDIDMKIQRRILEDGMHLSPVSVLEETLSNENSPIHNGEQSLKTRQEEVFTDSSIVSDSCKLLVNSSSISGADSCSHQYIKNKLALRQTKQLLFDCVKEIVETHKLKNPIRRQQFGESMGAEEIDKVLCENIWAWSKQSTHLTNTKELLDFDLLASAEEWSCFEQQSRGIGLEIAVAIFEEITNETVIDMMKFCPERLV